MRRGQIILTAVKTVSAYISPAAGDFDANATRRRDAVADNAVSADIVWPVKAARLKQVMSSKDLESLLTGGLASDAVALGVLVAQLEVIP